MGTALRDRIPPEIAVAAVFVAGLFMAIMDTTIVNVALPSIGRDFHVAAAGLGAVNIGYLVSLAVFIPLSGWLGDRFGTRVVFLAALVIFTAASALCATADSLTQLTVYRVIQGAGGGLLSPVGQTMLFRAYPLHRRIRAQRLLIVPTAVAPAIGPVLGGWLSESASWHWVFLVNVPIGVLALLFGLVFLPDYRIAAPGRFDIAGFLLAAAGFALVLYALTKGADAGWASPGIVLSLVGGAVLLTALVLVENRLAKPMLDLRLFGDRLFRANNIAMFALSAGFLGVLYLFPLFLQESLGYDALHSGLATFPEALGVVVATQNVAWLYGRIGPRRIMFAAGVGMAAAVTVLATLGADTSQWIFRLVLFAIGFGMGHLMSCAQNAAFATLPVEATGRASTAFNMQNRLSGAFGTALVSTLLVNAGTHAGTSVYHEGFLVTAGLALLAGLASLLVSDRDALRHAGTPREPAPQPATTT